MSEENYSEGIRDETDENEDPIELFENMQRTQMYQEEQILESGV